MVFHNKSQNILNIILSDQIKVRIYDWDKYFTILYNYRGLIPLLSATPNLKEKLMNYLFAGLAFCEGSDSLEKTSINNKMNRRH